MNMWKMASLNPGASGIWYPMSLSSHRSALQPPGLLEVRSYMLVLSSTSSIVKVPMCYPTKVDRVLATEITLWDGRLPIFYFSGVSKGGGIWSSRIRYGLDCSPPIVDCALASLSPATTNGIGMILTCMI